MASGLEDYFLGHGEAQGRWVGTGTADLGLSGTVDAGDFRAVFAGDHPRTGVHLAAANRTLPGYDLCFSPPKSVSVLFGLGDADTAAAVIRCHEEAVEAALSWLEDTAAVTRIGHNGVEQAVPPASLVPPSATVPAGNSTPNCTPTSSSPTSSRATTASGAPSTGAGCTSTPRPPASSTAPTSGGR